MKMKNITTTISLKAKKLLGIRLNYFIILVILLHILVYNDWFIEHVINIYAAFLANIAGAILGIAGKTVQVAYREVQTPGILLEIDHKCTGVYQFIVFLAGIFAVKTSLYQRVWGLTGGWLLLNFVNIIRIISLYYILVLSPEWFELLHSVVWEIIMVLFTFFLFYFWFQKVSKH